MSCSLKVKDFADQAFTRRATHDNLGGSTRAELLIGLSLLHLVVVLSLGIDSAQVCLLCRTFLNKSIVFSLGLLVLGISFDTHDGNLLLGLDEELLGLSLGLIHQSDCISLDLIDHNALLTPGSGQQNCCLLFCLDSGDIFLSTGLQLVLLLINPGSLDILTQLIHPSFVTSLKIGELLLLLILEGQCLVLVILLMVPELELKSCPLTKSGKEIWIDCDLCDVTLLKPNAEFTIKGSVKLGHHVIGHIRL
jgi:hypothetical protein